MHLCSCLVAAACAALMSTACFGQNALSFTTETSASGPTPSNLYAVDVNNDGLTDIIQQSWSTALDSSADPDGHFFSVSINKGNGTFLPPVDYPIDSSAQPYLVPTLTWGDFNNDGKVDIAVVLPGSNQVAVYLGNGDGTFQAPITSTIDLPAGVTFWTLSASADSSIVAADFNHDGNIDLVASAAMNDGGGVWSVYLLLGDGAGHFASPTVAYYPTSGWMVQSIVGGDFNTDGNADVTLLEYMYCSDGVDICNSNVVTLFGDGGTGFDPVDVTTYDGVMTLGSADLNNDGATDLYGMEYGSNGGTTQLAVFTGHYDENYSYYYTPVPLNAGESIGAPMAEADFDGNWDLAALAATYSGGPGESYQMVYFLSPGYNPTASIEYYPSPGGSATFQVGPVAGNFNGDLKPDIAVNASSATQSGYSPTTTLAVGLNNTPSGYYGDADCNYPSSGQGIRVCSPSSQTTPGQMEVSATANSFGMLRKIELWINGTKIGEEHNVWGGSGYFDWFLPDETAGTYNVTLYAANIDNTLQEYSYTMTVGGTCGPPPQGAYGVNICTPADGGTYANPVQVLATAKIAGTLAHMDVYVDGTKEYTETSSTTLNTTLTLSQTSHEIEVDAVNSLGQQWEETVSAGENAGATQ